MMFNHAPADYRCPFCAVARGDFTDDFPLTRPEDVIVRTDLATALICYGTWPNNAGNALVVPNQHFENIYDLPLEYATEIHRLARALAVAMRSVYGCSGVSTRQHNEPDGYQDVWHYHLHVFPRYKDDFLYPLYSFGRPMSDRQRAGLASQLRGFLELHPEVLV
jgi:histidine triad (HIT) family protein